MMRLYLSELQCPARHREKHSLVVDHRGKLTRSVYMRCLHCGRCCGHFIGLAIIKGNL